MATLRILHLTDFHLQDDRESLFSWHQTREALLRKLARDLEQTGPVHLVALTGDFAFRGGASEFRVATEFLDKLRSVLVGVSQDVRFAFVPGNHDLVRPVANDPKALSLVYAWENRAFRVGFDDDKDPCLEMLRERCFQGYTSWLRELSDFLRVGPDMSDGLLPGDFSGVMILEGKRIGVMGLNTAYRQLIDKLTEGSVAITEAQLMAVAANDLPRWLANNDCTIFMTHHPAEWLTASSTKLLGNLVEDDANVPLYLSGHTHKAELAGRISEAWPKTLAIQGRAVFGTDVCGAERKPRPDRGYALYELKIPERAAPAELRIRPYVIEGSNGRTQVRVVENSAETPTDEDDWTPWKSIHIHARSDVSRAVPLTRKGIGGDNGLIPSLATVQPEGVSTTFQMGCSEPLDELWNLAPELRIFRQREFPIHDVTISYKLEIAVYPVLVSQFEKFRADVSADSTSRQAVADRCLARNISFVGLSDDAQWGLEPDAPVVNVSWDESVAYCMWLALLTGEPYRLLSEAEWEFACRAGTSTPFYWGQEPDPGKACYGHPDWPGSPAVTSLDHANPQGIQHMSGLVWEWVDDFAHPTYRGAPDDGSAWLDGAGERGARVVRGGSFRSRDGSAVRSSSRGEYLHHQRNSNVGFRIARGRDV